MQNMRKALPFTYRIAQKDRFNNKLLGKMEKLFAVYFNTVAQVQAC